MAKRTELKQWIAIVCLILNLGLAGVGTIIGKAVQKKSVGIGVVQLVLYIIGMPLCLLLIGFPMVIGAWVWALITSINMLKEAE